MDKKYMKNGMFIRDKSDLATKRTAKRVLIVEDNPTYRRLLEIRLNAHGYDTIAAEDGINGLYAAKREKPDLIIVDLMIPEMDGHEVCRELKKDPEVSHIPVVILTCRNNTEDVELARREHVDAYVLKSMMSEVLIDVLSRLLGDKKHRSGSDG